MKGLRMTAQELQNALHITDAQLEQISSLSAALSTFEQMIHDHEPPSIAALRDAMRGAADDCIELIATVLSKPQAEVRTAVYDLVDVTDNEFALSSTAFTKVIALSGLVRRNQP